MEFTILCYELALWSSALHSNINTLGWRHFIVETPSHQVSPDFISEVIIKSKNLFQSLWMYWNVLYQFRTKIKNEIKSYFSVRIQWCRRHIEAEDGHMRSKHVNRVCVSRFWLVVILRRQHPWRIVFDRCSLGVLFLILGSFRNKNKWLRRGMADSLLRNFVKLTFFSFYFILFYPVRFFLCFV